MKMDDYEDKKSVFNAGVAQVERIDSIRRAIISSRFNPLGLNEETGTFNYEVIISSCDILLNEAWAKLSPKEKTLGENTRKLIRRFLEINPPIKKTSSGLRINNESYKKLLELLNYYEQIIQIFLDAHNLGNPSLDEDDGL